jgi:hypothetical protein
VRTDLTTLCPRCVARIPKAKRCARCGETKLFDLADAGQRNRALARIGRATRLGSRASSFVERALLGYLRWGVATVTGLAFLVELVISGSTSLAVTFALLAFIAQAVLAGAGFAVFGVYSLLFDAVSWFYTRARMGRDDERLAALPRILVAEPLALPPTNRERAIGRVRVAEPIDSLLRHEPCAAFRLIGEGPRGAVDDAGGTDFDVVSEDGIARVILGDARIDLPIDSTPATVRPDAALRAFLDARGIFPDRGPVRLAEGALREGDWVEIEGRARGVTESDGYRGAVHVRVFEETAGAPLSIRKIEPPKPGEAPG